MRIFLFLVFILVVCDAGKEESEKDKPKPGCESQLCNYPRDLEAKKKAVGCFGCFSCFFKRKKKVEEELLDYVPPLHNATDPFCQCQECFLFNEQERNCFGRKLEDCFLAFLDWFGESELGAVDEFAREFGSLKDFQR